MCYITDRQKGVKYAMWKHRTNPLAVAAARGFPIYVDLSMLCYRLGKVFRTWAGEFQLSGLIGK